MELDVHPELCPWEWSQGANRKPAQEAEDSTAGARAEHGEVDEAEGMSWQRQWAAEVFETSLSEQSMTR